MFSIRTFQPEDYPELAVIYAIARPDTPLSADTLRYRDQNRSTACQFQRFVAVQDERVVGFGLYTQYEDMFEPDVFWVDMCVLPDYRRQGIGKALLECILHGPEAERSFLLRAQVREDNLPGTRFAQQHGFEEFGRRWQSDLDVRIFDGRRFEHLKHDLAAQGIVIAAFSDLAGDPERQQKLHALQTELDRDVPMLVPSTAMTFEQFCKNVLHNPTLVQDGLMIAIHQGEYVGMSSLFKVGDTALAIDLTGTKSAYRRRGIATALKAQGILFAQAHGYERIEVHNDLSNQGMLAINEQLGFVKQPAVVLYVRSIGDFDK